MKIYNNNNNNKNKSNINKKNIEGIPRCTKYKYLGIIINEKWKLLDQINKLKK